MQSKAETFETSMSRGRTRQAATALVAALVSCSVPAQPPARHEHGLEEAWEMAGRDPERARRQLDTLHARVVAGGSLELRLAVDEARCRLLSDSDAAEARRVADAGAASALATTTHSGPSTRVVLLRLRACAAGAAMDLGHQVAGSAELETVIAEARKTMPDLRAALAIALLERGLHLSRAGELLLGQEDLLAACDHFKALSLPRDLELCLGHLANHYKRVGDTDEALRLLNGLLLGARAREATFDAAVYVNGLAQVHHQRGDWFRAMETFRIALDMATRLGDRIGQAYADHGIAHTLLRLGRASDALVHARSELSILSDGSDPVQATRAAVLLVQVLNAAGRVEEALREVRHVDAEVEALNDDSLRSEWLRVRADVQARAGHWRDAHASLTAWQEFELRQHQQQLSQQSARLRMQFNREKDAAELHALREVNEQEKRLVRIQALTLTLIAALLGIAFAFGIHKIRQARRLHRLAMLDELTGLPNRRAALARLDEELRLARRLGRTLSILMVDVDHFKRINDAHGHPVGDEVLRHVARTLGLSLRSRDHLGRIGGEEFLVVLPDTSVDHTRGIAERMREAIAHTPCPSPSGPIDVTISVGVATADATEELPAMLIERADAALYCAKRLGRNLISMAAPPGAPAAA
jgi:diguanylate cyclase (GGDEF)-like protein